MHTFTLTLTEDEVTKLKAVLAKSGIDVNSTTGTLPEKDGVVLSYAIHAETTDPDAVPVEFTVEHKRFFETTALIEAHVKHMIETAVVEESEAQAEATEAEQAAGDNGVDQVADDGLQGEDTKAAEETTGADAEAAV